MIPRGMYFKRHVIFTWNPRYNLIHVQLPFMSGCPLENLRGFYAVYLHGIDMDFTDCFCRVGSK